MNILITGGAGFIGSNLALQLQRQGHAITVLDNLSPQIHGSNVQCQPLFCLENNIKFIHGDVRNKDDWRQALVGQEIVVHLAAATGTGQSMYQVEEYTDINVKGTALLLDLLVNEKHSIKKVVVASSRAIYGEGKYSCAAHGFVYPEARNKEDLSKGNFEVKCPVCGSNATLCLTDETAKIHPSSIYGITKQMQEELVMLMGKSLNIPVVAFRYQNVYGPGQSLSNPYTGILSIFSTRIKNHNSIKIFEDGKESRDFVFIDDVVQATIAGIEKEEANFQVFNVGSGIGTDVDTLANMLKHMYHSNVNIEITGNYRLGDIRHNVADIAKINALLGYAPAYSLEAGLQKFVTWVNAQAIQSDNYEQSIQEMQLKGLYK